MDFTYILHPLVYNKHIQEQTDILTHRKVGGPDFGANVERALEVLIKVGLDGRLEGGEREGFRYRGKREIVPDEWAIGRERAGTEGGEFGARDVQAERVRGGAKRD